MAQSPAFSLLSIALLDLNLGLQADQVLPRLLGLWADSGPWSQAATMLVMLAVLVAIMSTADSVLLSAVSIIRHDLPQQTSRKGLKYDHRITVILMGLMAVLALYRDITLWRLIELKLELLIQCFPAFVIALHWKAPGTKPVLTGLVCGLLFMAVTLQMGVKQFYGINAGLVALAINLGVLCTVHLLMNLSSCDDDKTFQQS